MKKTILLLLILSSFMILIATDGDPRINKIVSYEYSNGWQQNRYTDYFYTDDDNLVDYTISFNGIIDSGTQQYKYENTYNEDGDIIQDMYYENNNGSWLLTAKMEYEYCEDGLDLKTYYVWENGAWEVSAVWDNLWQNGELYRMNQTNYSDYGDMELYDIYTYTNGNLTSSISYSYIEYYGGWVQMNRTEYVYNEFGISQTDMFNTDLNSGTEYHSFHSVNTYENGVLAETVSSYGTSASDNLELYYRSVYQYLPTDNEEHIQPIPTMSVYPNPCRDSFKLKADNEISDIALYDIKGRKVMDIDGSREVNTRNLANGFYFLKSKENKTLAKKVVVVK